MSADSCRPLTPKNGLPTPAAQNAALVRTTPMSLIFRVIARDGATPALSRVDLDASQVADANQKDRAKEDEDAPLPCGQNADDDRESEDNDRCGAAEHSL